MRKYYVIEMSDGSRWGVPAEVIADNYAKFFEARGEKYEENFGAMMYWFDADDYEFADWAKGSMDWSDVEKHAIRLTDAEKPPINWEDGWVNGKYEYITEEAHHD